MIPGSNASRRANQPGLTPTSWIRNRSPKWMIVRDSYFVATEEPEVVSETLTLICSSALLLTFHIRPGIGL